MKQSENREISFATNGVNVWKSNDELWKCDNNIQRLLYECESELTSTWNETYFDSYEKCQNRLWSIVFVCSTQPKSKLPLWRLSLSSVSLYLLFMRTLWHRNAKTWNRQFWTSVICFDVPKSENKEYIANWNWILNSVRNNLILSVEPIDYNGASYRNVYWQMAWKIISIHFIIIISLKITFFRDIKFSIIVTQIPVIT